VPRLRAHPTTLARCSGGNTLPVGLDGEFSQISATRSGPIAVSESARNTVAPATNAPIS